MNSADKLKDIVADAVANFKVETGLEVQCILFMHDMEFPLDDGKAIREIISSGIKLLFKK